MRRSLARLLRSTRGNAAVEFCLILPPMLLLGVAAVEFGLTYHVYNQTNRLATQYALVWSDCQDDWMDCKSEMETYATDSAKTNIAPQLATNKITLRMFQVRMDTAVPVVVHASPAGTVPNTKEIAAAVKAIPIDQTGVIVTATYAHTLKFFPDLIETYLSGSKLKPSYTVAQLKT